MSYQHITDACFQSSIGEYGIAHDEYQNVLGEANQILATLKQQKEDGSLPLLSLTEQESDLAEIVNTAEQLRSNFDHIVILGTGGSTTTGQALVGLTCTFTPCKPQLYFMDNIDPHTFTTLLHTLPIDQTCFLVISKSGGTLETIAQFGVCIHKVSQVVGSESIAKHFVLLTDPGENPLRSIGEAYRMLILNHIPEIGGRFSVFTNVGLLPATLAGLDISSIRTGAVKAIALGLKADSPPAAGAALSVLLAKKGVHASVMMPYIDRLDNFTTWYRQVWAESLGKQGMGTTPIKALGTLDHHSQLQLYLDGPRDKMFTLISLAQNNESPSIDGSLLGNDLLSYLDRKELSEIVQATLQATKETLVRKQAPVRQIILDHLDEETLGMLIMHFMLETIVTAYLLGINPFDQPAVEEGKILARQLLSRNTEALT